jgi:hypothetical protein
MIPPFLKFWFYRLALAPIALIRSGPREAGALIARKALLARALDLSGKLDMSKP